MTHMLSWGSSVVMTFSLAPLECWCLDEIIDSFSESGRAGEVIGVTPGAKTEMAPLWTGWECHNDPLTLQGLLPPSRELSLCFFSLYNNQHWNSSGQKGQDKSTGDYEEVCIGQAHEQRKLTYCRVCAFRFWFISLLVSSCRTSLNSLQHGERQPRQTDIIKGLCL